MLSHLLCTLPSVPLFLQVSDFGLSRLVSNDTPIIETRTYGKANTNSRILVQLSLVFATSCATDVGFLRRPATCRQTLQFEPTPHWLPPCYVFRKMQARLRTCLLNCC